MTLILGIAGSFIAITGFAVLLETPRKYVPLAGLVGAIGGGIYLYCTQKEMDVVLASFLSALAIAFVSHVFARVFKAPVTVFLIAGILPTVPGAGMYRTVYYIIADDRTHAAYYLVQTLEIAGVPRDTNGYLQWMQRAASVRGSSTRGCRFWRRR